MRVPNRLALVVALALTPTGCHIAPARSAGDEGAALPLRSVRLYENGVGYFEREGLLSEHGATLGVPASHVDDALKTLLVLSQGDAKVSGVEFASVVSDGAARSLAGLPLSGERPIAFENLINSLKGFRIEVQSSGKNPVRGRLLDVQGPDAAPTPTDGKPDAPPVPPHAPGYSLLLATETGALVRVRTNQIDAIQPIDPEFSARLQTAADALTGRAAQLGRDLRVLSNANSPVRIGYIAEAPVWRSSYRLVLPPDTGKGMLQGWALVHNDTDEAWAGVAVELVNGSPDSFLYPLAAPRYDRRTLNTPETELSTVPQLALKTPDALWGDHVEEETFGSGGLGLTGVGEGGGGMGYGAGHGSLSGSSVAGAGRSSSGITIGDLAQIPSAAGTNEQHLFSYRLPERVSLRAHGSALLPMLSKSVTARRLTRFVGDAARASIRFTNDSPYILPAGPVAIYESAGFAGEALIPRLTPDARIFLAYGNDLDVSLETTDSDLSHEPARVVWDGRSLHEHFIRRWTRTLRLENQGAGARLVAHELEHVVRNAKVEGADELDFDDAGSLALALVKVPARGKVERTLHITEGVETSTLPRSLDVKTLTRLATAETLPEAARGILRSALPHANAMERAAAEVARLEADKTQLNEDLSRNREHLAAAKDAPGQGSPLAVRVVALEHQLEQNRRDVAAAQARVTTEVQRLGDALRALTPAEVRGGAPG